MLGGDAGGRAVRSAEHDRRTHLAAGHIERLGRRIDDLVDRLHGEVEGHELDDRLQAGHRRADADAGEAVLGDRRVDHAARAELLQQPLRDLVGALILGDFLAHDEDVLVAAHLFGHRVAQRFAHRGRHHLGAGRDVGIGGDFGLRRGGNLGSRLLGQLQRQRALPWLSAVAAGLAARLFLADALACLVDVFALDRSRMAIGVLTFTPSVPAGTTILPSVPSSTASTSMVALSVSISAITSPATTLSPSFFSHLESCPLPSSARARASEFRSAFSRSLTVRCRSRARMHPARDRSARIRRRRRRCRGPPCRSP